MDWKRPILWIASTLFVLACGLPGLTTPLPAAVPPTLAASPTFTPDPPAPPPSPTPVPPTGTPTPTPAPYVPSGPVIAHIPAGKEVGIRFIRMFDALNGWAIAPWTDSADHLLRTADGGQTWRDVTPPDPPSADPLRGKTILPHFLDPSTAWAIFSYSDNSPPDGPVVLWSTRDGGLTWQPGSGIAADPSGGTFAPYYIDFVDPQDGWLLVALGAGMNHVYSSLYHTTDGGRTWTALITPYDGGGIQSCAKTGLDFVSPKVGWLAVDCHGVAPVPYILNTIDGGRTWARVDLPPPPDRPELFGVSYCGVFDPSFTGPQAGLLVLSCQEYGNGRTTTSYLYRTGNSGLTWQVTTFPGGALVPVDDQTLYAISRTIHRSDDGGATWLEVKTVYWDPQVSFIDKNTAWAVATNEREHALVKTANGGASWDEIRPKIAPR